MTAVQEYYRWLQEQQDVIVAELERYVTIESGSRDKEGVDRVGRALSPAFSDLGFTIERIPEETCGDHLVARRSGSGTGRLLVLIHLDTVWPAGSLTTNPFRVDEGRVYGPGTRDMKGGWVVLLAALRALRNASWAGLAETTAFITGDEELGSPRGRPWIEREARRANWALVMEPARDNGGLVTRRGMVGAVYFDIEGQATHATSKPLGVSAIVEAAHKILALEALTDVERGILVNVGIAEAGNARQVIPDHARLSIDLRAPGAAEAEALIAALKRIAADPIVPGTRTVMSGGITRPAFETSPGTEHLLQLAQACGRELGLTFGGNYTRAGSDGNFTATLGVPTLDGLGPEGGSGASRREHILLASIPQRAAMLAGIIAGLPGLLRE
ncbi:MAG: M20 family metallopeptidase [Thermomicrobiales bacterium]